MIIYSYKRLPILSVEGIGDRYCKFEFFKP